MVFFFNALYLYLTPHYTPNVVQIDLNPTLNKNTFNQDDYHLLFEQTGLSESIINELKSSSDFKAQILQFQKDYLSEIQVFNLYMPPATFCQIVGHHPNEKIKAFTLAPYHNGYLFYTNGTHSFGWRHGHIGLVVDEVHGLTLEALSPGTSSCLQNIHKWEYYPTFKMMRLKNVSQSKLDDIANYALAHLQGLPYNVLSVKKQATPHNTQCALLIWQAFSHFGYDLALNSDFFIFPDDIVCSPLLEVLQIYGFNPNKD